jgi:hypothetical protein
MNRLTVKRMAKLILVIIFLPLCLNAQDEKVKTLLGGDNRIGAYGAFETKLSQLDNGLGFLMGGRGGVIINNVFSFGGGGYGLLPSKKFNCPISGHELEKDNFWTGGYGGLFFEYINSSNEVLHFTVNTLIGAGAITYVSHSNIINSNGFRFDHPISVTWVFEPGVTLDLNVTKFFRMGLGISYRYAPNFEFKYTVDGVENDIVPNTAFNGISINLAFKFGDFTGIISKNKNKGNSDTVEK